MEKGSDGTAQGDISLGGIANNGRHRNGNRDKFSEDVLVLISPSIHSPTEVQIALMVWCDTAVNHAIGKGITNTKITALRQLLEEILLTISKLMSL